MNWVIKFLSHRLPKTRYFIKCQRLIEIVSLHLIEAPPPQIAAQLLFPNPVFYAAPLGFDTFVFPKNQVSVWPSCILLLFRYQIEVAPGHLYISVITKDWRNNYGTSTHQASPPLNTGGDNWGRWHNYFFCARVYDSGKLWMKALPLLLLFKNNSWWLNSLSLQREKSLSPSRLCLFAGHFTSRNILLHLFRIKSQETGLKKEKYASLIYHTHTLIVVSTKTLSPFRSQ